MNDVAKEAIRSRLLTAMENERLNNSEASRLLDVWNGYIGFIIKNKFGKVSDTVWDKLQKWTNSGETIKEYSKKNKSNDILVIPKKNDPSRSEKIKKPKPEKVGVAQEIEEGQRDLIKVVRLLEVEKIRMIEKIKAIETLLELYR